MAFPNYFPAFKVTQDAARYAREKAAADKFFNYKPREVTYQQLKAYDLEHKAQDLKSEIDYRIKYSGLTQHEAKHTNVQLDTAIETAQQAMKESNKAKATRLLTKANRYISNVNKSFNSAISSMQRGTRGGTLRRKHRKSVKRCKS
jgi:hypothetical protein